MERFLCDIAAQLRAILILCDLIEAGIPCGTVLYRLAEFDVSRLACDVRNAELHRTALTDVRAHASILCCARNVSEAPCLEVLCLHIGAEFRIAALDRLLNEAGIPVFARAGNILAAACSKDKQAPEE